MPSSATHDTAERSGGEPDRPREEPIEPSSKVKKRSIAVVTYAGVALLDLVATKKVLDRLAKGSRYRPVSIRGRTAPIASDTPLRIVPEKAFEEVPDPFALVVPGGGMDALKAMGNERLLDSLRFASHGVIWSSRSRPGRSYWPRRASWRDGGRPPTRPTEGSWRS